MQANDVTADVSWLHTSAVHHLRSAQGVLRLADTYTSERLDAACARAVAVGDPSYKTVKGILVAGTETTGEDDTVVLDAPAHLHGPHALFDLSQVEAGQIDTGEGS